MRDPVGMVISGFLYHNHSTDTIPFLDGAPGPELYSHMNLRDGLITEAAAELQSTIPDMLETFETSKKDHRVLTVRLEDFSSDFDGTTRRIFTHFLGPYQDKVVSELITAAAAYDISRWSHEKKIASHHIARREVKTVAVQVLESLLAEHNPYIEKIYNLRATMGYKHI